MHRLLVLSLVLLVAAPVFAQDPLNPGHPDIDVSTLATGETYYTIHVKQGSSSQNVGTVAVALSVDEEAGLLEGIRAYEMMGQKMADTVVTAWPSMAAISHISNNPQRTLRYTIEDGLISGARALPGGEATAFEMSVDGPVFDASWMSTIASLLPLADGYETAVTAFQDEETGIGDFTLRTSGPMELMLEDGQKHDAWEITSINPEGESVRYFLRTSDRSLLRIAMNPQPGIEVFIDAAAEEADDKP